MKDFKLCFSLILAYSTFFPLQAWSTDYNPQVEGDFDATVTINSDDPNDPAIAVQLIGSGGAFFFSGGGCSLESAPVTSIAGWLLLLPMAGLFVWMRREG